MDWTKDIDQTVSFIADIVEADSGAKLRSRARQLIANQLTRLVRDVIAVERPKGEQDASSGSNEN